jgi:hypothetical protein
MLHAAAARRGLVFFGTLGISLATACQSFSSSGPDPADSGAAPSPDAEAAPDGALFYDSAETERCRHWVGSTGNVEPIRGDGGSWYCRFCVMPATSTFGAVYRDFAIPGGGDLSIYEADVLVSEDAPDSGVSVAVAVHINPDGGFGGSSPVTLTHDFGPLQAKAPPSVPSQNSGRMEIDVYANGCVRFDQAYVLRY